MYILLLLAKVSESGLETYAIESNFQLYDLGLDRKEQGGNGMTYVDEDTSSGAHREVRNMKDACYQLMPDTLVGWISEAMRMEEPYAQKLLIYKKIGRFLITGNDRPPEKGHNDLDHRKEKNTQYFVIVNS